MRIERLAPRVDVGLIHWPACTNDPCTCLESGQILMVTSALASVARMLNDRDLRARVDKMYYDGSLIQETRGFDWYMDPSPFALYDYVGFLFL